MSIATTEEQVALQSRAPAAPQPLLLHRGRYAEPDARTATGPTEVVDTLLAWPRHADWI